MPHPTSRLSTDQPSSELPPAHDDANSISDAEAAEIHRQRLEAIRHTVEAGLYDSDELLRKALRKMISTVDSEESSGE